MQLQGIDLFEMYVEDAQQTAELYMRAFGFRPVAEAGPETGLEQARSVVLASGTAYLVLTSALRPEGPVADYVRRHGDSVRDVAFTVPDAQVAFREAVARGAVPISEPSGWETPTGRFVRATVAGFGDVVHSFIDRKGHLPTFLPPPYRPLHAPHESAARPLPELFQRVDHVAMCLSTGTLEEVVEHYRKTLGFVTSYEQYIETDISGMNAKVVEDESGTVKFPLQEPLPQQTGPIADFVAAHNGPGVYHVGLLTADIIETLRRLRGKDVFVLETPPAYYRQLPARVGPIEEDIETLRELNVLVDRDPWGYLLQVFTRSLHPRKTFFVEVIQRREARSFGSGNVRALFDAVEREGLA